MRCGMAISINRNVPAKHRTPKPQGGGGDVDLVIARTTLIIQRDSMMPVRPSGTIPAHGVSYCDFQTLSYLAIAQACGVSIQSGTKVIDSDGNWVPMWFGIDQEGSADGDKSRALIVTGVRITRAYDTHYSGTHDANDYWVNMHFDLYNQSDSAVTLSNTNLAMSYIYMPVWRCDGQPFARNQILPDWPDSRYAHLQDLSYEW